MALELENLVFSVSTGQLDDARIKLAKLGDAVNALNKPMQDIARSSAKTNEVIAKSELAAEKARQAQKNLATETENSSEVVKKQTSVLERQQMILEFMTQGYSKGQSSQLAYAKAAGAITTEIEQLGKVLQTQRTLMGTDPFDKSIGAMQALKNEYTVIKEVQRLYNAELGLSRTQMEDLAKEKIRLIEKYKLEGKTLSDIKEGIIDLNQQYIRNANAENSIISAMKDKQDILKSQAAAEAYLAKETERVNRLIESKGEITSSTNNRLIKYEQALKASGVSSEVAAAKLAKYKEQLLETQKVAGNRQMDYLSRALGPQITDIFVGLATGQNPMTVLLQQGGQLRDQFALAGVEGANMGKALTTAFASMYDSTKNVAIAVGTMLVDGFIKLGLAATTVVSKMTGDFYIVGKSTEFLIKNLSGLITLFPALETAIIGLGKAINFSIGAGVIALFAGLAIAFKQIVNEEGELSRALLTTGAALGFSKQSAIEFAQSLDGVSESKVKNFLTELAKNSVENTGNLKELTKTAVDLEKYAGISLDETAKRYAELQKNPVEALTKLAIETGRVNVKTLEQAESMKEAKNYTGLAALANQEFARTMGEVAAAAYQNMSPIEKIFASIKSEATAGWTAFKEWANTPEVLKVVEIAWRGVSGVFTILLAGVKQIITGIGAISNALEKLGSLDLSGAFGSLTSGWEEMQRIGREATQSAFRPLTTGTNFAPGTSAAGDTAANARAAKMFQQLKKDREETRKQIESDNKKIENSFDSVMKKLAGLNNAGIAAQEEYSKAQKAALDIFAMPEFQKFSTAQKIAIAQAIERAHAEEVAGAAAKKGLEDYEKALADFLKVRADAEESVRKSREELNSENQMYEFQNSLIGISSSERELLISLKKEDLKTEREIQDQLAKGININEQVIQDIRQIGEERKKLLTKTFEQKEFKEMQDALSGAIADALFEGGKKGADSLKNYLKTTFRKFVIDVFINPVVGSIMSSAASALGLNPSSSSTTGQLIGAAKTGSNVYSAVTGSFAKAGAYASMAFDKIAVSKIGQQLGLSSNVNVGVKEIDALTGNVLSDSTVSSTQMTAAGEKLSANIGQIATSMAASLVGQALRKAIAGGFKMNKGLETVANIAAIAAGFDPTGISQIVVGVASGLLSRAFGTKLTQAGIQGTFGGAEGFTGSRYTFEKGGWFRRDKTRYQPLEEEIRTAMALSFAVTKSEVQKFSDYLGIGAEALSNFSYQIKVNLMGLSEDDAVKTMQEVFNQMKDAMAAAVLEGKKYAKEGETQYQTLERLATTVYTVNSMFKDFGANLLETGFAGVDAALAYSEYFGGLDKLSSSLSSFYDKFYTDSEKVNNLSRNLTDAFSALGFEMPKTRDEFKKLVLSVIELGDPALLKDVLSLQDGFVSMTETAVNSFKELTDGIQSEIDRLLGANLTSASSTIQGSAMRTEFDVLSALARGGDATALAKLPEFSQAIEKNMTDFASSASDVIFARAMLAQSLSDTMSSLGGNTTVIPSAVGAVGAVGSVSTVAGVSTAAGTSLSAAASSQSDLISMLVAEIQGLRAEVRADVSANTKTSKILERANQDGETISISGALDGGVI